MSTRSKPAIARFFFCERVSHMCYGMAICVKSILMHENSCHRMEITYLRSIQVCARKLSPKSYGRYHYTVGR